MSYRHRTITNLTSCPMELPKLSRARKVSTEADTVVSFVKCLEQVPCSKNFEKKFYLKRNSDVVEQRMCYNTRVNVTSRKDLLKILRLVADEEVDFLEKSIQRGCLNEAVCSEFVKTNLINEIILGENKNSTGVFNLHNVSFDAFGSNYTRKGNEIIENSHKMLLLKNILKGSREEKKVGDIYFEYTNENLPNFSFYVIMQVFEKPTNISSNMKQKLKKILLNCAQEIKKFNLPHLANNGNVLHASSMEEMIKLDMSNWKVLNYKFKSSKDESFYKQIRRKNRTLSEI